jgi:O-antigen/teichoic acid export membrane protein
LSQVIRLASNLILTRLLVPEMFGLMTLANLLLVGVWLFSDLGLKQSVVQSSRGHEPTFLNTAWVVQIIRGIVMWLMSLLVALGVYIMGLYQLWTPGSVYAEPLLPTIIAIIGTVFLISGFESTKLATASREMLLKRVTIIELGTQVLGIVFMVVWAWIDRSIWALVFHPLITVTCKLILSHTALPGEKNRFEWDSKAFHEIFHFGKWIFISSILGFLSLNGDRIILGDLIDAKTLGLYSIAYLLFSSIQEVMFKVTDNVAFPVLSEIARDRPDELKKTYYRFRKPLDIITLLSLGLLFAAGDLIIIFLYDDRYLPAGHMLQVLSIGLFISRYNIDKDFFMAIGKPKLMMPVLIINILVLYVLLPIIFKEYGIDGSIWAIGAAGFVALPLISYLRIKHNLFDLYRELIYIPLILLGYFVGMFVKYVNSITGLIT